MLVTQEEASQKNCILPDGGDCVGCECMGWRWSDGFMEIGEPMGDSKPEGEGWVQNKFGGWIRPYGDRRLGYCGIAGKPHPCG